MHLPLSFTWLLLMCLHITTARGSSGNVTPAICQQLGYELGDQLVTLPNETEYESLRRRHWVQIAWGRPQCILSPTNTQQLSTAVKILAEANVKFAVRSGGHSPHHGFASADCGVLIELSGFTRLDYNQDQNTTAVGVGRRWGQVYDYLAPYGVSVTGGRLGDVGVGGFILGSGLAWDTSKNGLGCDNVINFQVVLANGSVVDANAQTNPDLFWALKGGGNNFGIVTEYTLATFSLGKVWGGIRTYTLQQLPMLMRAYREYQSASDEYPSANLIMTTSPTNESIGIIVSMVYLEPVEPPSVFSPFLSINATIDTTGLKPFTEYIKEYVIPTVPRLDWSTANLALDESLYDRVVEIMQKSKNIEAVGSLTGSFMALAMQPISPRVVEQGQSKGGNALGLAPTHQTWVAIAAGWLFPDDDHKGHEATRGVAREFKDASVASNSHLPYLFMNDATWDQDVIGSYGEENVARLQQVQSSYDPDRVFQRLVRGGFKLPQ